LQRYISGFFEPVTAKASPEPLPPFSPGSCEEKVCDGIPEFRTIQETDWFKLPWTPVKELLPKPLLFVLLKFIGGDVRVGYLRGHGETQKWYEVRCWGFPADPIGLQEGVAAWTHLPGADDA